MWLRGVKFWFSGVWQGLRRGEGSPGRVGVDKLVRVPGLGEESMLIDGGLPLSRPSAESLLY